MKQLSYKTLKENGYGGYLLEDAPERVLQFGEGNFLRCFVDDFIDIANEKCGFGAKVVVAQPIAKGLGQALNAQNGLYTRYLRGYQNGREVDEKRLVSCVSRAINPYEDFEALLAVARGRDLRYIVSNTTEAGIVYDESCKLEDAPPASFPAKLTRCLYERYLALGSEGAGLVVLSCELIDHNGEALQRCVEQYAAQWALPEAFLGWLRKEVLFCSTLVDRIVTGYPADAKALDAADGYEDKLRVAGEVFAFWAIQGPAWLAGELPFAKAGLPVTVVEDISGYKQRKVRILNGAHTAMVLAAYLAGKNIVRECMQDDSIRGFMQGALEEEIIPGLTLPRAELDGFAAAVSERFQNPFIDHSLLAIALNSVPKWRARVLPSVKAYIKGNAAVPKRLAFSLAALLQFYCGTEAAGGFMGNRGSDTYAIADDDFVIEFFTAHAADDAEALVQAALADTRMWGEDLTALPGFAGAVAAALKSIRANGAGKALAAL